MKKVVRLTESELNRLVKRIVNESPFDMSGLEKYTDSDTENDWADTAKFDRVTKGVTDAKNKYKEFQENGIPMKEEDVTSLLYLAKLFCSKSEMSPRLNSTRKCRQIDRIEKYVDDIHSQNFSKRY